MQAGKQQQADESAEWNIWNVEKKISFIDTLAQIELLIFTLMIFKKKLN